MGAYLMMLPHAVLTHRGGGHRYTETQGPRTPWNRTKTSGVPRQECCHWRAAGSLPDEGLADMATALLSRFARLCQLFPSPHFHTEKTSDSSMLLVAPCLTQGWLLDCKHLSSGRWAGAGCADLACREPRSIWQVGSAPGRGTCAVLFSPGFN